MKINVKIKELESMYLYAKVKSEWVWLCQNKSNLKMEIKSNPKVLQQSIESNSI